MKLRQGRGAHAGNLAGNSPAGAGPDFVRIWHNPEDFGGAASPAEPAELRLELATAG
jgi:hypothetical protein